MGSRLLGGEDPAVADQEGAGHLETVAREVAHAAAADQREQGGQPDPRAEKFEEAAFADESVFDRLTGDCWIVDPLDGTRNFARGAPPFGILLAMAQGGEAHTGWIYDVLSDRFCVAHHGKGAFVNGEKIAARSTGEAKPVAAVSLLFMDMAKRDGVLAGIGDHYRLVDVPWCAAEQYPRLALGVNDLSLFERTQPWDHAAGVLWLNEAGGKCARLDGSPYRVDDWQRKGLLGAASPALWEEMAERLAALPD